MSHHWAVASAKQVTRIYTRTHTYTLHDSGEKQRSQSCSWYLLNLRIQTIIAQKHLKDYHFAEQTQRLSCLLLNNAV